jgi:hypothetical protein
MEMEQSNAARFSERMDELVGITPRTGTRWTVQCKTEQREDTVKHA